MKQPKGLYLLFFVEMWERFSYYGMRALLMLYMIKGLQFTTENAGHIYGWYCGLVYLTPLIGGYIADRYLGARKSILIGGILMAVGHFVMAFPALPFFFSALGLIILGNGFFKPNISTVVGKLYSANDIRREAGFTIFYMGINLGAFFSPLICGTLGEIYGWHYGFAAAGVGMIGGLGLYLWGQHKYLGEHGIAALGKPNKNIPNEPLTRDEKFRIGAILVMCFFMIFFWASFEQAGSSLTLFADNSTDRMISFLNWEMPASYFQSINPLFIFVLAPIFSDIWIRMAKRKIEPSTPMKFVWGLVLVSLSFVVMIFAAKYLGPNGKVGMFWLTFSYFLATLGELCLSPVGLSMVTKLSPIRFGSLLMGTWFLSDFAANYLGGLLAGDYDKMPLTTFFSIPAITSAIAAFILLLLVKPLNRWMQMGLPPENLAEKVNTGLTVEENPA